MMTGLYITSIMAVIYVACRLMNWFYDKFDQYVSQYETEHYH